MWENLRNHDDLFVVGHGGPTGLFSTNSYGLFIDASTAPLLKREGLKNKILWCNADKFVNKHELNGFYSGMFISEVGESVYCGVPAPQSIVDESNNTFAELLGSVINKPLHEAYQYTKYYYERLAEVNVVAEYNNNRLYLREGSVVGQDN